MLVTTEGSLCRCDYQEEVSKVRSWKQKERYNVLPGPVGAVEVSVGFLVWYWQKCQRGLVYRVLPPYVLPSPTPLWRFCWKTAYVLGG